MLAGAAYHLGRRLERLFYFGSIILFLTACDYFIASGVSQLRAEYRETSLTKLVDWIELNKRDLKECYEFKNLPQAKQQAIIKEYKDYPSILRSKNCNYQKELLDNFEKVKKWSPEFSKQDVISITNIFQKKLSPAETVEEIKKLKEQIPSLLNISSIEIPTAFTFSVSSTNIRMPIETFSFVVHVVLFPVLLLWLASIAATRNRELLSIAKLGAPIESFPHILNVVPIHLSKNYSFEGFGKKKIFVDTTMAAATVRCFIVLLICLPPVALHTFTTFQLSSISSIGDSAFDGIWFVFSRLLSFIILLIPIISTVNAESHPNTRFGVSFIE